MKIFCWIAGLAFTFAIACPSHGQISPLRLKVTKNFKKDMEGGSQHIVHESITYTIEITNASPAPVKDISVRWAMMVSSGYRYEGAGWTSVAQKILEGEHTCSVDRIQKCVFDTDEVEIAAYTKKEYYARYKSDITAYYVEALVNGAVVASEIQPANAKIRIEEEKNKKPKGKKH